MKNWKTTALGAAALFGAASQAIYAIANGDFTTIPAIFTSVSAGFGLIFAKDAEVAKK